MPQLSLDRGDDTVLVRARAAGLTVREAGELCGVSERTARRRLKSPDLIRTIAVLRAERQAEIVARLEDLAPTAIARLAQLLEADVPGVQLQAARTVLTLAGHRPG